MQAKLAQGLGTCGAGCGMWCEQLQLAQSWGGSSWGFSMMPAHAQAEAARHALAALALPACCICLMRPNGCQH